MWRGFILGQLKMIRIASKCLPLLLLFLSSHCSSDSATNSSRDLDAGATDRPIIEGPTTQKIVDSRPKEAWNIFEAGIKDLSTKDGKTKDSVVKDNRSGAGSQ
jgi:hypothetical protein